MKTLKKINYFLCIVLILFFANCKKSADQLINLTLNDKPLSVIRANITGDWQVQYERTGPCNTCTTKTTGSYFEFGANDKVKYTYNNIINSDTTIVWKQEPGIYTNSSLTYTMNFSGIKLVPDKIVNDTLVLHDYAADATYYYLTKK